MEAGFFGECPASELITGDELARNIGLKEGNSQYVNEPWLKFAYMGKIEFIAKKPFRSNVSWDSLNFLNVVYGNKIIKVGDNNYKIRLIKGKKERRQGSNSDKYHDSEWNRLMLPIHLNAPNKWKYKENVNSPTENWNIYYGDSALLTSTEYGKGSYTWCQETDCNSNMRLSRGGDGVSSASINGFMNKFSTNGWRPVLELVD